MNDSADPELALALGGGAVWGAAHIGVLRALRERDIRPGIIVGSSVGALIGAATAAGIPWQLLAKWSRSVSLRDMAAFTLRPRLGVLDSRALLRTASTLFGGDRHFDQLPVTFGAVATDVFARRAVTLNDGSVLRALRASMAVPGLVEARPLDGRLYIDGGCAANLPLEAAYELGATRIIGVRVREEWERLPFVPSRDRIATLERRPGVMVIRPRVQHHPLWHLERIPAIIAEGYRSATTAFASDESASVVGSNRDVSPATVSENTRAA